MSSGTLYPHLTRTDDGGLRIGTSRYKVAHIAAEHYHHGWSAEELLRQHPDLRPEEVYSALTYFYDHFDAMVVEMKESFSNAELVRPTTRFSRDELLRRRLVQES